MRSSGTNKAYAQKQLTPRMTFTLWQKWFGSKRIAAVGQDNH
jgi:hypothetical protein